MSSADLTAQKVIAERDIQAALKKGATEAIVRPDAILTPTARDLARKHGLAMRAGDTPAPIAPGRDIRTGAGQQRRFDSPEAEAVKNEIVAVGRKLWQRQYVDGNGGNISFRLSENAVICTPTLISKADLMPEDLCLVDLEGNQLVGARPRTSEILLHLEIYKAVPEARAVVHCHPPHATAYAITGRVPPTCVIPEYEVFIGSVALSAYETPGTQKFAETVLPFVRKHNTVLLANHGIVCWADTVTHAEWYAEVVETYCWTLMLAAQLGAPITHIPSEKAADLLAVKKRLGLPDARLNGDMKECRLCDLPDLPGAIAMPPRVHATPESPSADEETEAIVQAVTNAVLAALDSPKGVR
ncbi:MAG: class II aldolase/adducin family protein [Vicinamibacteria bacterium]|nr:class II aldolase/adducin family protein [Vicinamibacteria bacterium]